MRASQAFILSVTVSAFSLVFPRISEAQFEWQDLVDGYRQNLNNLYSDGVRIEWTVATDWSDEFERIAPQYRQAVEELKATVTADTDRLRHVQSRASWFKKNPLEGTVHDRYLFHNCERGFRIWRSDFENSFWDASTDEFSSALDSSSPCLVMTADFPNEVVFVLGTGSISNFSVYSLPGVSLSSRSPKELMRAVVSPIPIPPSENEKYLEFLGCCLDSLAVFEKDLSESDIVTIEMEGSIAKVTIEQKPVVPVYTDSHLLKGKLIYLDIDTARGFLPLIVKESTIIKDGERTNMERAKTFWGSEVTIEVDSNEDGVYFPKSMTRRDNIALFEPAGFVEYLARADLSKPVDELIFQPPGASERLVARSVTTVEVTNVERWESQNPDKFLSAEQIAPEWVDEFVDNRTVEVRRTDR